ncbi:hypothetical protein Klosneuvirus_1_262 [Klosneuvirus KNV1]|uniref:Uncharacterized protein n=1 Tax=Klosneuvirus KNV1 TaxID=1977640 RepID=A0A1V0SI60_9VIRU|nr:hypothetical protein Klosneuvirus_1_262 [Klosneuvirus KNV1]
MFLSSHRIFRYLISSTLLFLVLYYIPAEKLDIESIAKIILLHVVILIFIEQFIRIEGMRSEAYHLDGKYPYAMNDNLSGSEYDYSLPDFRLTNNEALDQYLATTDADIPGYYLSNNGKYTPYGTPYDKVQANICKSELRKLYEQQNFPILSSPHTHFGKARGYLNWDKVYL